MKLISGTASKAMPPIPDLNRDRESQAVGQHSIGLAMVAVYAVAGQINVLGVSVIDVSIAYATDQRSRSR